MLYWKLLRELTPANLTWRRTHFPSVLGSTSATRTPFRQHSFSEVFGILHIVILFNVTSDVSPYWGSFPVSSSFSSLRVAEVDPVDSDTGFGFHWVTRCQQHWVVITPSLVLADVISGCLNLRVRKVCSKMRTTADVSCKQFLMIYMNVWLCSLSSTFRATTLKCHESPCFPNQQKDSIAQSWVMRTAASSSKFKQPILAWSCRTMRSWCAFQDVIAFFWLFECV